MPSEKVDYISLKDCEKGLVFLDPINSEIIERDKQRIQEYLKRKKP